MVFRIKATAVGLAACLAFSVVVVPVQAAGPNKNETSSATCFQTFNIVGNPNPGDFLTCPLQAGDSFSLTAENAMTYEGQQVHRIGPGNQYCAEGIALATATQTGGIEYSTYFLSCLDNLGENKYCTGPCPVPPGATSCVTGLTSLNPIELGDSCTDNGGNPPSMVDYNEPCLPGTAGNVPVTYTIGGTCYLATCSGNGLYTFPTASCSNLGVGPTTAFCFNRECPTTRRRELGASGPAGHQNDDDDDDEHATTLQVAPSFLSLKPQDASYQELARKCGSVQYSVLLFVSNHFYAIALPQQDNDDGSCPIFVSQAIYKDYETHYHKVLHALDSKQHVDALVLGSAAAAMAAVTRHRNSGTRSLVEEASLPIGTFQLDDLRRAHESIDPKSKKNKAASYYYDIVTNNCADYMLSLAAALNIKIDTKVTSYVTRRLLQEAGKDLVHKVRQSVHFGSLLLAGGGAGRNLRRAPDGGGEQPALLSDDHVIEALVEARATNLIG